MPKKKKKSLKNLFYSSNESWWIIGFSIFISGGMLTNPQIITSFLLKGNLEGMWIIWAGLTGVAFGKAFFAHLWKNVPVKTENELILFRFSGKGAKILHAFRSIYVGGIIAPLGLAMVFLAFGRILAFLFDISDHSGIIISLIIVLISTFFNSLRQRLRLDNIYLLFFIVILIILFSFLVKNIGSLHHLSQTIHNSSIQYRILPKTGTKAFTAFLVFFLVQWWSASIIDFPNLTGQKLMAAKKISDITKSVVLPSLLFSVFTLVLYTIPFYILMINPSVMKGLNGEEAFMTIFPKALPDYLYFIVVLFFLLPFITSVNSTQNWAGSLLVQNFYIYYIRKDADEKHINRTGLIVMILIAILSATTALFADSILGIIKYLFVISAGVGPVFILRWYWYRINAWSQLSAMISSLIYANLYQILYDNVANFKIFIDNLLQRLNMDFYPLELILLTIAVCLTWLIVTFLTKPTNKNIIERFAQTVKPGGCWNVNNCGKIYFWKRFAVAIIFVISDFSFYITVWHFVNGDYILFGLFYILYLVFKIVAYIRLNKVNNYYDKG
ncbi:MAG: hypothetical protein DRJ01_13475 [Bacteroidetes bacterium]|nr:MAG: hypothetical protein DRJ01_13475 [Bacteroidota bacterium]